MFQKLFKTETIEITIKGGATQNIFYFPDIANLRDMDILSISPNISDVTPKSLSNVPLWSGAVMQYFYMVMVDKKGLQVYNNLPCIYMERQLGAGGFFLSFPVIETTPKKLNFPKCYIFTPDITVIPVTDTVASFTVNYYDSDQMKQDIAAKKAAMQQQRPGTQQQIKKHL